MNLKKFMNRVFKKNPVRPASYASYIDLQMNRYKSHELAVPKWEEGQRRYLTKEFSSVDRGASILDISCGDGVGLRAFKSLLFENVIGFEYDKEKAVFARRSGYEVIEGDFHDLNCFESKRFDIVYSSHSLEHAFHPEKVVCEFHRVLSDKGRLFLVLPFPDEGPIDAHVAKTLLGTDVDDEGVRVVAYIESFGFELSEKTTDNFREPEIWLKFRKV